MNAVIITATVGPGKLAELKPLNLICSLNLTRPIPDVIVSRVVGEPFGGTEETGGLKQVAVRFRPPVVFHFASETVLRYKLNYKGCLYRARQRKDLSHGRA